VQYLCVRRTEHAATHVFRFGAWHTAIHVNSVLHFVLPENPTCCVAFFIVSRLPTVGMLVLGPVDLFALPLPCCHMYVQQEYKRGGYIFTFHRHIITLSVTTPLTF
jgi:hypothetical protein